MVGWLCWVNHPLRQYFSLYWAVFQKEGDIWGNFGNLNSSLITNEYGNAVNLNLTFDTHCIEASGIKHSMKPKAHTKNISNYQSSREEGII